jgi:hypothetical protein
VKISVIYGFGEGYELINSAILSITPKLEPLLVSSLQMMEKASCLPEDVVAKPESELM